LPGKITTRKKDDGITILKKRGGSISVGKEENFFTTIAGGG